MLYFITYSLERLTQGFAKIKYLIICTLILLIPYLSIAAQFEVSSKNELQAQYQLLKDLKAQGTISDSVYNEKFTSLSQQATDNFNFDLESGVSLSDLPSNKDINTDKVPDNSSDIEQRIDNFTTALYAISALLLLAFVGKFMSSLPPLLNEILVYSASIISLTFFHYEYWVLVAGFSLGSVISYSVLSRISDDKEENKWVGWPLAVTFFILALLFKNSIFGIFSILALLATFGFIILIAPGLVAVGTQDNRLRQSFYLTLFSFFLTLFAWLVFYTDWFAPLVELNKLLHPFEFAMLTLFPLAYFSGISQLRFFLLKEKPWLRLSAELIGLFSEITVITIALLYKLDTMFYIGVLFLTWNFMDKFNRLVFKHVSFVVGCTLFALLFAGVGALIRENIKLIKPLISFLAL